MRVADRNTYTDEHARRQQSGYISRRLGIWKDPAKLDGPGRWVDASVDEINGSLMRIEIVFVGEPEIDRYLSLSARFDLPVAHETAHTQERVFVDVEVAVHRVFRH